MILNLVRCWEREKLEDVTHGGKDRVVVVGKFTYIRKTFPVAFSCEKPSVELIGM